jgi:hypothetical protein
VQIFHIGAARDAGRVGGNLQERSVKERGEYGSDREIRPDRWG